MIIPIVILMIVMLIVIIIVLVIVPGNWCLYDHSLEKLSMRKQNG